MASLTYDGGRAWRIQVGPRGKERRTIRFAGKPRAAGGEIPSEVHRFHDRVSRLELARDRGERPDAELLKWLAALPDKEHGRLVKAGIAAGRMAGPALGTFMVQFFGALTGKPATIISYRNVRRNLEDFFGADKPVQSITSADADAWRAWMVEHEKLATPTISRRVIAARTMWRKALRWGMATANPFDGVKTGSQANEARKAFVPHEVIDRLIEQAPDTEWKVIIAAARYLGLRIPSELYALRWGDIDFEAGTVRVLVPKLEHHEGQGARTVPMFPEIRVHLQTLFTEAQEGAEHVIVKHRLGCLNLRQQMERLLARAGIDQWPKMFHNLRGSRESELMREYDLTTVCKWIGNSPTVAARHYAMSIDLNSDFQRAIGPVKKSGVQTVAAGGELSALEGSATDGLPSIASQYTGLHSTTDVGMGRTGLEPVTSAL